MTKKLVGAVIFILLVFFSCGKDSDKAEIPNPQPDAEDPLTEESMEEDPEPAVTEGVSEEDLIIIQIEVPTDTDYTQYKVVDYQGRETDINETMEVGVDRNSEIRLVDKSTDNVVYIGYFNINTSTNKGTTASSCQDAILNSLSTARYLVTKRMSFGLSKYFTPTPNGPGTVLGNFYESGLACEIINQTDVNNISGLIDNSFEATKGALDLAIVVSEAVVQGALDVVTGGIFSDCPQLILEIAMGTYEYDDHPQFALDESLNFYSSSYPERPYVETVFMNTFNTGVIIDEAIPHPEKKSEWIVKFKTYNNLPIPLGVRLGRIKESTDFVIETANDELKYFLDPSGNSIIQMVREGFSCEGVNNNVIDAILGGNELQAGDYSFTEVEFEMDQENRFILFEKPNESNIVRLYQILEIIGAATSILETVVSTLPKNDRKVLKDAIQLQLVLKLLSKPEVQQSLANPNWDNLFEAVKKVFFEFSRQEIRDVINGTITSFENQSLYILYSADYIGFLKNILNLLEADFNFNAYKSGVKITKAILDGIDGALFIQNFNSSESLLAQTYEIIIPEVLDPLPNTPNPVDGTIDVPLSVELNFTPGDGQDNGEYTFHLFLDTQNPPDRVVDYGLNKTAFQVDDLEPNTDYYWKIEASKDGQLVNESSVWSFTTVAETMQVEPATNPSPSSGAIDVPISGTLSFTPGDNTPSNVIFNLKIQTQGEEEISIGLGPQTSYSYSDLNAGSEYLWKIETVNSSGNVLATTPIWRFTTEQDSSRTPANGAIDQPLDGTFSFAAQTGVVVGSKFIVTYYNSIDPTEQEIETLVPEADYSNLLPNTEYFWYVKVISPQGSTLAISDTWSFKTIENETDASAVYLDENGVSIKAYDWAKPGDNGNINGMEYLVVDRPMLLQLINNGADVSKVCTSLLNNMSALFKGKADFNGDISSWDVSNVTDFSQMFLGAKVFNSDISNWKMSSGLNLSEMFGGATLFNQDISNWDLSGVVDASLIFSYAVNFNQDISSWDVSNVINMSSMFFGANSFNQDLSGWDVSKVESMGGMFALGPFNGNISNWNVSNVTSMNNMFFGAAAFNTDISGWDVSKVLNMTNMFKNTESFNINISNWDVINVTECKGFNYNSTLQNENIPNFTNCNTDNGPG